MSELEKPFTQWICDSCDQPINGPKDGYLEWLVDENRQAGGFKIVHHTPASPRQPNHDCYHYDQAVGRMDGSLEWYIGPNGLVALMAKVDVGPTISRRYDGPELVDLREWAELVRRLQVPHYEQARQSWDRAEEDGWFDGMNEKAIYSQATLKQVIGRYG